MQATIRYWLDQGYSRGTIVAGHLLAAVLFAHAVISINMPRTAKTSEMREVFRGWHYLLGFVAFGLVIYLLWHWLKERPIRPGALSPLAHAWTRALVFSLLFLLLLEPFLGILNAWGDGLPIHLGPTPSLPAPIAKNRELWLFAGYFHSALSFSYRLLQLLALATMIYTALRYGAGMMRAFLPGLGLMMFLSTGVAVYAATTFKSPEPGPRAVAIYIAIALAMWALVALLNRRRQVAPDEPREQPKARPLWLALIGLAILIPIIAGLYGPYAMFRVSPFPGGPTVVAPEGVTSHSNLVTTVTVVPETALERQVLAERFKWCGFCHTFEKGGEHLAGPNLYGIFGRPVASVPNFPYTDALVAQRAPGRVWDDQLIGEFLLDPDAFAPGTSMVVSAGNVSDPDELAALINILKKKTMGDAVKETAAE